MIVTCPQCSKRYLIDDASLSQRRRVLRCGPCGHTWSYDVGSTPSHTPQPAILPPALLARERNGAHRASSEVPSRSLSWGWALYLAVWIGLLGGFIIARDVLVTRWPILRSFYETVGLPIRQTESLVLRHLHMWPVKGEPDVLFRGEIVNTGSEARSVPSFFIQFDDIQNTASVQKELWRKLFECWSSSGPRWTYQLSHRKLMPHEQLHFEIILPCDAGVIKTGMQGKVSF